MVRLGRPRTVEYYDQVIRDSPDNALAYFRRGQVFLRSGEFLSAAEDIK